MTRHDGLRDYGRFLVLFFSVSGIRGTTLRTWRREKLMGGIQGETTKGVDVQKSFLVGCWRIPAVAF